MKKQKLLELLKKYPDDIDIEFTDESDNQQHGLSLTSMTEDPGQTYVRLWFSRTYQP